MLFRKSVLECFHDSWRGNRARDKSNSNWFEGFRRETLGGEPGPETVAVACHRRETCNSVIANEVVNLAALDVCGTVIASTRICVEPRIARARPRLTSTPAANSAGPRACRAWPPYYPRFSTSLSSSVNDQETMLFVPLRGWWWAVRLCESSLSLSCRTELLPGHDRCCMLARIEYVQTSWGMNPGKSLLMKACASVRSVGSSDR